MSWSSVPATELMVKRGGSIDPSNFPDETFELLSIPAFDKNEPEILKGSEIGSSKSCIEPGDVLLSKIIPHTRRCWVVPKKGKYRQIGSGEWIIFRDERFDHGFLKHFLTSNVFHGQFMNTVAGVGGSLVRARPVEVGRIEIPLPPLTEQKRIAAILDKADAIRRKRKRAIQLADDFLRALFLNMFGDPVTNPKGWKTKTIEQLVSAERYALKRGPFGGALKKEIFVEDGYLVYEQYHALNNDFSYRRYFIDEEKYQELKAFEVRPKDLIVSCSGVNLGRLAEVPEGSPKGIINQALMKITLNQDVIVNQLFIDIFSNSSFKNAFYGDFRGAAIPNFPPMSIFKEFRFIVPPIELQKKYIDIKEKLRNHSLFSERMNDLRLFEAISEAAFSGEL